jgi:hypothetical protein
MGFNDFISDDNWDEPSWEIELHEEFNEELIRRRKKYKKKTDREVLCKALECGPELNKVTDHFPAYDVALKLIYNNWKPTEKQRIAIINVTTFFKAKRKFEKDFPEQESEPDWPEVDI